MKEHKQFYKELRNLIKKVRKNPKIKYAKIKYKGKRRNAELDWYKLGNPVRLLWNALIFQILRKTPPCRLKNAIYRMFGIKIGKEVAIAYNCFMDPLFPELITIEDGALIGSDCEFGTHEFVNSWIALGRLKIKKDAMISGYNLMMAGVTIGEKSATGAFSFIKDDIPPNEFWAGIPAKFKAKLPEGGLQPKQDLEQLFAVDPPP